jgi:hypothetical protein
MKRKTNYFKDNQQKSTNNNNDEATQFETFSQFIESNTQLEELINQNIEENDKKRSNPTVEINTNDQKRNYGLVGLHSCGNLSNSIVNLYLSNNNNTTTANNNDKLLKCSNKLLCNVSCCYNLLAEKYEPKEISGNIFKNNYFKLNAKIEFYYRI